MKTKKMSQKLMLKKSTIVNLDNREMVMVQGGATLNLQCVTEVETCNTTTCYDTGILYSCTTSTPFR